MIIGMGSDLCNIERIQAALDLGEAALLEAVAVARERGLDPLDAAQVGAQADDHRAASISSRIRTTALSSPVKIASPIR